MERQANWTVAQRVALGKLEKGTPSLTTVYWETITTAIQLYNDYREWCPLELFYAHLHIAGKWQSPRPISLQKQIWAVEANIQEGVKEAWHFSPPPLSLQLG
jgi:hypothetical protein